MMKLLFSVVILYHISYPEKLMKEEIQWLIKLRFVTVWSV